MEAYLDNSATTRCCEEAAQLVVKLLTEDYGNPSSLHNKGVIAGMISASLKNALCMMVLMRLPMPTSRASLTASML